MNENTVVERTIKYLQDKGWTIKEKHLGHEQKVDIKAFHPKNRRYYYIEAKGDPGKDSKSAGAQKENYFISALGEIVLRIKSEKAPLYGIALPESYEQKLKKIDKKVMKRLNLHFLIVRENGKVNDIH
jgi:hypothetical protein